MAQTLNVDMFTDNFGVQNCPRCQVTKPHLKRMFQIGTMTDEGINPRAWAIYMCSSCAGLLLIWRSAKMQPSGLYGFVDEMPIEIVPKPLEVSPDLPSKVAQLVLEATQTVASPNACVMVANSAVDAMLKEKSLTTGSLYSRIEEARDTHLITPEMADWAHDCRLTANEPRHADNNTPPITVADAERLLALPGHF